jgi:hypothetical protein
LIYFDKSFSQLLGAKPVDGLRLSQSLWAKSENLLRSASHVLGTAEFFLSAVGTERTQGLDLLAEEETLPLLDPHLPCPEARHRLLTERTQQYPEHVKHYGASSPIWPTRTEKGVFYRENGPSL